MALDEKIYELRREKLKQIEALGQPVLSAAIRIHSHDCADPGRVLGRRPSNWRDPRVNVRVAGRIMAIRLMGKAGFAHLQQDGKKLQIYVKKDAVGDKGFELYKSARSGRSHRRQRISVSHAHRRTLGSCRRNEFLSKICYLCRRSGTA